jgi:hypothetical protein
MADAYTDNRIKWLLATTGDELAHDAAATNGATYYAEITRQIQNARGFWAGLDWDATDDSDYTLESSGRPSSDLTAYVASNATGWKSQATALGTISSASSASCDEWQVSDAEANRWRVKRVVTTGGVANLRCRAKSEG